MAKASGHPLFQQLRKIVVRQTAKERTDRELLQQFAAHRDESAFAALVERYSALVWGVCQRVLRDRHEAEDAFQATFLVLTRRADSVCKQEAASSWLYGVAYRTAMSQKRASQRRREREKKGPIREPEQPPSTASLRELQTMLDDEVARLPAKYRAPFVLCCLEGKSYAHAAQELGCKEGTISSRLAKARKQLQQRLLRRGVTLSSVLCAAALSPTVEAAPPVLITATIEGVLLSLAATATTALSAEAITLANGVTKMSSATMCKLSAIVLLAASSLACVGFWRQADTLAQPFGARSVSEGVSLADASGSDDKPRLANAEMREEAEMHVIGVYGSKNGFGKGGKVEVEVRSISRPVVLVLTSYLEVDWHVKLAPGARIKKIIVNGYYVQKVKGVPAGVPIANQSFFQEDGSRRKEGWFYAYRWNDLEWREMVRRLNTETGLPLASFQGEYTGESFIVDGERGRDKGQKGAIPRPRMNKELTPKELLAASAGAELDIVGIGCPAPYHRGEPVEVEVRPAAKPIVLVLADGDNIWNVKCAQDGRIKAIILVGGQQEVDGVPADIPIQYFCDTSSHFGWDRSRRDKELPGAYQWNSLAYRHMVERLNDLTGLLVTTFQGKDGGTSFVVDGKRGRNFAQKERKPRPTLPKEPTPQKLLAVSADAELHVVSICWPEWFRDTNRDTVDVEVRPTDKPIVLALVSYMSALWNVKLAPGARVKAVVIAGYFEQEFEGIPADVPIVYRAREPSQREDYFFGHEWNAQENSTYKGKKVAERLKELTGLPVATFQGVDKGTSFLVDGKQGRDFAAEQPKADDDPLADVKDIPSEERRAGDDENKRYFSIGPKKDAKQPVNGYGLLVILPGGDGSADFHPFVKRIYKNALSDGYLAAQPIAVKWTADQKIVWPTKTNRVAEMKFSTEEFVDAVIRDLAKKHKLDRSRVFTLSWSSSSPAAYATSLRSKNSVKGSFIAMSVFNPKYLPSLKEAKGHAYYLYHSPDDRVCPYRMAEQAKTKLADNGAKVRLDTYEGGHGWRGNLYEDIRGGVDWLEKQQKPDKP